MLKLGMVFFAIMAVISFVAACCGYTHQMFIGGIYTALFMVLYYDYEQTKGE